MSYFWHLAPFVFVALLIVGELFCVKAATTTQTNVWTKRSNATVLGENGVLQGPSTTPWPALGARKQAKPINAATSDQNRKINGNANIGIALSYGPETGGTSPDRKSGKGSQNSGITLSYAGTTSNQNQNKPNVVQSSQISYSDRLKTGLSVTPLKPSVPTPANPSSIPPVTSGSLLPSEKSNFPVDEDEELREFSEALLRKDVNNAGKYVTVNYQGKTTSRSKDDEAPLPLLSIQKDAYDIPTISDLLQLHNNYILETNVNEHVSAQEKMEENSLLDDILSTSVMQHTKNFLIQKGVIPKDPKIFRDKLKEIWFNMYSRGQGKIGSSGFEHVFLAEIKKEDVSGLHNWLYFNEAEAKKSANYLGYLKKIELGNNKGAILKFHFTLNGVDKPVGSMFIGTSPELEIALYSTCFLLRADKVCPLKLGGNKFIIRTYTFRYRGKNMIGSAFPEI